MSPRAWTRKQLDTEGIVHLKVGELDVDRLYGNLLRERMIQSGGGERQPP